MNTIRIFLAVCIYTLSLPLLNASPSLSESGLSDLWLPELEQLKVEIESELQALAHISLNSGIGAVGYRSPSYAEADHLEWVQVDLQADSPIDTIFIVPTLWRDTTGFVSDAFPAHFTVSIGTEGDAVGRVVYEYNSDSDVFTGISPLQIPLAGEPISWIRVAATRLSPRALDDRYVFQISDIMAFEGDVDRALRKPVTTSSREYESRARNAMALVDGILPYLINSGSSQQSRAYVSPVAIGDKPSITIDLLEEYSVSGVRLHGADQSDTVPTTHAGEFGMPIHFILQSSNSADFADATLLLEAHLNSIFEIGPFVSWNFPEQSARYIRLTALEPYIYDGKVQGTRLAFAEIEVLQDGLNIATNKSVLANFELSRNGHTVSALTDGLNIYGEILPQRQWLGELVRRHELESTLHQVKAELSERYARQKVLLRWAIIAAVCLLLLIVFTIPYNRMLSYRKEVRIRERIAANLHDELGANLHAIGMLGDVAERSINAPQRLIESVRRIRKLTERTGAAARHCTNMLEAESICEDVVLEIEQDAQRLLSDYEVRLHIEGKAHLHALPRRKRLDLYLFFKECLTNINRHAMATRVYIRIIAKKESVIVSIIDNGCGHLEDIPKSLSRRARFMRATLKHKQVKPSGTHIQLKLDLAKFRLFKR
ncbi:MULTISPECIES: histidine kinase [unclassified Lentimonas]|uniref:histidine kinase n=1 Tax=unclassified Lentimonas TaxID=2630993 RepID=UPI001389D683|nr:MULTISPECIES: histidine kinase [unclassified Lentimonas]